MEYTNVPLLITVLIISIIFIRINLVGMHLHKAIKKYGKRNIDLIWAGQEDLMFDIEKLDISLFQYIRLALIFTKWTFKDFFPDL